jgi:uncharacterized membrane protein
MHLLVIGFKNPDFHGQIRQALGSAMEKGVVRLIDLRFVWKDADGNVEGMEATQLDDAERKRFGAAVGALIGFGAGGEEGVQAGWEAGTMAAAQQTFGMTEENVRKIADIIPKDSRSPTPSRTTAPPRSSSSSTSGRRTSSRHSAMPMDTSLPTAWSRRKPS